MEQKEKYYRFFFKLMLKHFQKISFLMMQNLFIKMKEKRNNNGINNKFKKRINVGMKF